ncbi:MAG: glycoside hydrolase family 30 beta sandwich domain-containing protein [Ginsengibacter sp.]
MRLFFTAFPSILCIVFSLQARSQKTVELWLTNADKSALFQKQKTLPGFHKGVHDSAFIEVNEKITYQSIDGFGFALTGGSAMHIIRMSTEARSSLLNEIFGTAKNSIGVSYLRVSIGASDLNESVFSYDDLPAGTSDTSMQHFDLGPDKKDVIPVLKEIISIYPGIKILASPWSPPSWMKTNNDTRGGRLKPEYYKAYVKYFLKYIQGMKAEGITIDAITVQNEPLHPGNNPSLLMTAPDEAEFIKNYLGPAFKAANVNTKIILYDHNADRPDYPIFILNDPQAYKYIDGSGFHLYGGKIEALSIVHDKFPEKNLYFTEQMVVDRPHDTGISMVWPVTHIIVGATRNWCRNVLLWNLAADPSFKPFTDRGGCPSCQGAVTIDGDQVTRNTAYYTIAHASKFVRPGSLRIASSEADKLPNVAFKTPDGKKVLIVVNGSQQMKKFDIVYKNELLTAKLEAGAVGTYIW